MILCYNQIAMGLSEITVAKAVSEAQPVGASGSLCRGELGLNAVGTLGVAYEKIGEEITMGSQNSN